MRPAENHFVKLYQQISDSIFRYCYYRIYDRETAIELMQEAFTRAWQYIADDREVSNLRALVYRIARNLIYDHREKNKSLDKNFDITESPVADTKDHSQQLADKIEVQKLLQKISQLSPDDQELIILRFIEDLRPREIAKILNQSTNVISVRISRAKKQLRQNYNHYDK